MHDFKNGAEVFNCFQDLSPYLAISEISLTKRLMEERCAQIIRYKLPERL